MMRAQTEFLRLAGEDVHVTTEAADPERARDTAVLICPPFGWPEVSSYRIRRAWARQLAGAGYTTMRLSLPSTGDSGGTPVDPARFETWTEAVREATQWLRAAGDGHRIAVLGLELGGILALAALGRGACIDDLVLWATPGRGRSLLRELRAFSRIEGEQFFAAGEEPPALPDGDLHVGGFRLSADTVAALDRWGVDSLELVAGSLGRALLLERDGIPPDMMIAERLEAAGAEVGTAPGEGYGAMTNHPQQARPPNAVFEAVSDWLHRASTRRSSPHPGLAAHDHPVELAGGVRERPLTVAQPFGELIGILSEPPEPYGRDVALVLLNAGAVRRTGPGRMWVEIARRWAARGIPVLRLDLQGIGDADGDVAGYAQDAALYVPEFVDQALASLDVLERRGISRRFVLGGLCSGAYWSFHAALRDPRVVGACLLNSRALFWHEWLGPSRDFRRAALHPAKWRKLSRIPRSRYVAMARWAAASPRRLLAANERRGRWRAADEVERALNSLSAAGKSLLLLFSGNEPLYEELVADGYIAQLSRWQNVTLELVPGTDHTLRPLFSQSKAHAALDRHLERALGLPSEAEAQSAQSVFAGAEPPGQRPERA